MSFESSEENHMEARVNAVFENVSGMTARERMGIAAFDLLQFIDEERSAQDEVQRSWFERDKDARRVPRKSRPPFGRMILEGFAGLGMGIAGGHYSSEPLYGYQVDSTEEIPDELSGIPTPLERARTRISMVKDILPDVYDLTPRQIKKVEKQARNLKS